VREEEGGMAPVGVEVAMREMVAERAESRAAVMAQEWPERAEAGDMGQD
jgi:hypothetical protein